MTSVTSDNVINTHNDPVKRSAKSGAELRCCSLSWLLVSIYGALKNAGSRRLTQALLRLTLRLEGGEFYSATARKIMLEHHGINVGAYSYGCFDDIRFPGGVRVGRFASIARSVRSYRRNHPCRSLSTHPMFFSNKSQSKGILETSESELLIDHDAWVGAHAVILPGCTHIGIGAVIGAGAVVTRNVDPYAIVAGNPAKVIGHRFEQDTISRMLESRWWENPNSVVIQNISKLEKEILEDDTGGSKNG